MVRFLVVVYGNIEGTDISTISLVGAHVEQTANVERTYATGQQQRRNAGHDVGGHAVRSAVQCNTGVRGNADGFAIGSGYIKTRCGKGARANDASTTSAATAADGNRRSSCTAHDRTEVEIAAVRSNGDLLQDVCARISRSGCSICSIGTTDAKSTEEAKAALISLDISSGPYFFQH